MSVLIRPRLTDYYDIPITQEKASFAIPFLDEDIPLFLDPFLLWKSPSQQDNALHDVILNSFNHLGMLYLEGKSSESIDILKAMSECTEVGLDLVKQRRAYESPQIPLRKYWNCSVIFLKLINMVSDILR